MPESQAGNQADNQTDYQVKSMTAFARKQNVFNQGSYSWEIRSVNQRYLEVQPKLPEAYRHLETAVRETVKKALSRGKLDIHLSLQLTQQAQSIRVNQDVLQPLSEAICQVQRNLPEATQVNPLEVLQWPGVLDSSEATRDGEDSEADDQQLLEGLQQTLEALTAHRLREGQALAELIEQRCQAIETLVSQLQPLLPEILAAHSERLKQRIADLSEPSDKFDQGRFHQEVAIIAQKADVEEELDRLTTHLKEVRHVLHSDGPIGRRLDFLMQELNREANTLGSKSIDSRTSQASVELKVLIEQMREQVQNIE